MGDEIQWQDLAWQPTKKELQEEVLHLRGIILDNEIEVSWGG